MKVYIFTLTLPVLLSSAFVPQWSSKSVVGGRSTIVGFFATAQTEAEKLLQRAKELRESALQAENNVHVTQAEKKAKENAKRDELIHCLFFEKEGGLLVDRLHKKNLSIDTLEHIVDRLDEREVIAEGKEHVCLVERDGKVQFERVAKRDEKELAKIQGKIEELIEAVKVLDEEFRARKGDSFVSHTEEQHWGSDKRHARLNSRAHEIRREREEQFQKRLEEFNKAQRRKTDHPAPPKVKDDHGFIP